MACVQETLQIDRFSNGKNFQTDYRSNLFGCGSLSKGDYIIIRMKDNRLFILNFRRPHETVEFYNRIKDAMGSVERDNEN